MRKTIANISNDAGMNRRRIIHGLMWTVDFSSKIYERKLKICVLQ